MGKYVGLILWYGNKFTHVFISYVHPTWVFNTQSYGGPILGR